MATKEPEEQGRRADEEVREKLPPGVKLLRTLEGHKGVVFSVAFDLAGRSLASGSADYMVKLWNLSTPLNGNRGRTTFSISTEIGDRKSGTDHVFHFRSPETVVCPLFPGMPYSLA